MNKNEFLEILKDYLKKDFSEDDINDILRDYEEYFIEGAIEGKSEVELIQALGSPKSIANELILEAKQNNKSEYINNKDKINDKYSLIKLRTKENLKNAKYKLTEKLTLNLQSDNRERERKLIEITLVMLSISLLLPTLLMGAILLGVGISLIASLIIFISTMPFMYKFLQDTPSIGGIYASLSLIFIGIQIISWQIFIFVKNISKSFIKKYKNWLKTRSIYINASKKKKEYEGRVEDNE